MSKRGRTIHGHLLTGVPLPLLRRWHEDSKARLLSLKNRKPRVKGPFISNARKDLEAIEAELRRRESD